jgi:hypothetical protein
MTPIPTQASCEHPLIFDVNNINISSHQQHQQHRHLLSSCPNDQDSTDADVSPHIFDINKMSESSCKQQQEEATITHTPWKSCFHGNVESIDESTNAGPTPGVPTRARAPIVGGAKKSSVDLDTPRGLTHIIHKAGGTDLVNKTRDELRGMGLPAIADSSVVSDESWKPIGVSVFKAASIREMAKQLMEEQNIHGNTATLNTKPAANPHKQQFLMMLRI